MKKEEAVVVETQQVTEYDQQRQSVEQMIMTAIEKGVPIETMERILAMRTQLKQEYAKEQFDKAMAKFQGDCPVIVKRKQGSNSKYAPLDSIVSQVKDLLKECGFSYRIEADMNGEMVKATCIAIHKDGHSEESSFSAKVEKVISRTGATVRTAMQDSASSLTFAKRYAFCNAFGIMTGEEDLDGRGQNATVVSEDEVERAKQAIKKCLTPKSFNKTFASFDKSLKVNRDLLATVKDVKALIEENGNKK